MFPTDYRLVERALQASYKLRGLQEILKLLKDFLSRGTIEDFAADPLGIAVKFPDEDDFNYISLT